MLNKIQISKSTVLICSLAVSGLFVVFFLSTSFGICSDYSFQCKSTYLHYALSLLWAPVLLFLTVISYRSEKKIFDSWIRFVLPWVLLSSVIVLILPIDTGGVNWEALAALLLAALFVLFSVFKLY